MSNIENPNDFHEYYFVLESTPLELIDRWLTSQLGYSFRLYDKHMYRNESGVFNTPKHHIYVTISKPIAGEHKISSDNDVLVTFFISSKGGIYYNSIPLLTLFFEFFDVIETNFVG
ncbi:hypothetical protein A3Q29_00105 [Providencia stuartii]|uniref:Uncharacterized protein n=1 Tax=Providencia stuartii TaxID=588 RepID=A0A1S1HWQ8_PROST|nr:hypothetical protein A3Q29_00105 [Providencia stuartii]